MTAKKAAAKKRAAAKQPDETPDSPPVEVTQPDETEASPPKDERPIVDYKPQHAPLEASGLDQQAAEDARESARQAQRDEHNRRVGDASRA